jgi:hypothetical protein
MKLAMVETHCVRRIMGDEKFIFVILRFANKRNLVEPYLLNKVDIQLY